MPETVKRDRQDNVAFDPGFRFVIRGRQGRVESDEHVVPKWPLGPGRTERDNRAQQWAVRDGWRQNDGGAPLADLGNPEALGEVHADDRSGPRMGGNSHGTTALGIPAWRSEAIRPRQLMFGE